MKRIAALLLIFASIPAMAASHSVALTWTASTDSTTATPGTVNVYRATGACPTSGIGTLSYTALATGQAPAGTYTDSTVTVGTYCYYVTATIGGVASGPSSTFLAGIGPAAPATLTGVVH